MADIPINNFDIIFISYDEDNAEENWADLRKICPWDKEGSWSVWVGCCA